ncbi:MarR family transcriptional regulator [Frankia sp. Mgl5]|uniref:MarR family winged helix-turn-helix transcriptional regulator n=1 Tax=Frankia sp. Mgl5 TaxID=2933793 RepID=UPI00200C62E6|nr:MarR family transcriptional regulator [Frankia sp. Mgl5]MCK9928673.1 MarR family transcriptional regulator [Frankia sp. Mgl5]
MTGADPGPPTPLSGEEEAFLRAFGRALLIVPRALDADLLREQHMSLNEYTALMLLSESPGLRLRMSDLAAACSLSISGMTRIVSRLQAQGLVRREQCPGDRRGWYAALTDSGLARLGAAWPTHVASVRRHVMDHLAEVDLPTVTAALQRFASDALNSSDVAPVDAPRVPYDP